MDNYKKLFETYVDFSAETLCLRDVVYDGLKSAIVDGHIKTGSRIVEKRFADQMNISRTPVREALKRLEAEGFIEYVPNVGAVVKCIDEVDILNLYNVKTALEELMLPDLVATVTPEEVLELKEKLKDLEVLVSERKSEGLVECYWQFQKAFRKIGRNKTVIHLLNTLDDNYDRFKQQLEFHIADFQLIYLEAASVVEAVESRDLEALKEANQSRLQAMKRALIKSMVYGKSPN